MRERSIETKFIRGIRRAIAVLRSNAPANTEFDKYHDGYRKVCQAAINILDAEIKKENGKKHHENKPAIGGEGE